MHTTSKLKPGPKQIPSPPRSHSTHDLSFSSSTEDHMPLVLEEPVPLEVVAAPVVELPQSSSPDSANGDIPGI